MADKTRVFVLYNECNKRKHFMKNIDKEKLNSLKEAKGLTIREISDLSGVPESSLSKIFAGLNDNPTVDTLKKIAKVLNCIVDDFLVPDDEKTYYSDRQTAQLAQEMFDNPELRVLMDASKLLDVSDLNAVIEIVKRIKGTKY